MGLGDGKPAAFTEYLNDGITATTVGEVAPQVTYFIVSFNDGQQLKLLPVTAGGHRYVAWMGPLSWRSTPWSRTWAVPTPTAG